MLPGVERVKQANLYIKLIVSFSVVFLSYTRDTLGYSTPLHSSVLHNGALILKGRWGGIRAQSKPLLPPH